WPQLEAEANFRRFAPSLDHSTAMALDLAVRLADPSGVNTPLLALLLPSGNALPAGLKQLDTAMDGALSTALKRGDFRGARDETLHLQGGGGAERVLLVGMGKP